MSWKDLELCLQSIVLPFCSFSMKCLWSLNWPKNHLCFLRNIQWVKGSPSPYLRWMKVSKDWHQMALEVRLMTQDKDLPQNKRGIWSPSLISLMTMTMIDYQSYQKVKGTFFHFLSTVFFFFLTSLNFLTIFLLFICEYRIYIYILKDNWLNSTECTGKKSMCYNFLDFWFKSRF